MPVSVQEAFGLWPEGEPSPTDKLHLRHSSVAAWFQAEGLIGPLTDIEDEVERERRLREYGEFYEERSSWPWFFRGFQVVCGSA